MKKFIKKILLSTFAIITAFSFSFLPISVVAEEVSSTPENNIKNEEIIEDNELIEETPNTENNVEKNDQKNVETTFEGFLEWSKKEAEKYGYGDEYAAAIETIKAAASQEQVTISTIASLAVSALVFVYIIYNKVKDKKFRDSIADLSKNLDKQLEKIIDKANDLVNGTNANSQNEEIIQEKTEELKEIVSQEKQAIEGLINGFMHFTDGVKLKDGKKAEVQKDLLNALNTIDKKE